VCIQVIGEPEGDADADLRALGELAPTVLDR